MVAERAEDLGLRSKKSLGAIKRSIYFGSSLSLEDGLRLEHAEFLVRDQSKEAQNRMLDDRRIRAPTSARRWSGSS